VHDEVTEVWQYTKKRAGVGEEGQRNEEAAVCSEKEQPERSSKEWVSKGKGPSNRSKSVDYLRIDY
jgi:hypothetical protein